MLKPVSIALLATLLTPATLAPKAYLAQTPKSGPVAPLVAPEQSALSARGYVIEQDRDGLFYISAEVNGVLVRFVVDSGASVVILSAADAARAGVTADGGVSVDTAGGAATMKRARLQRLALAGQALSDVEAVIMPRNLGVSLLGQSALTQMRPMTFRGNRLELH